MSEQETPPEQTAPEHMTRQHMLKNLLGLGGIGWLLSITYPVFKYLVPPPLGAANVSSLKIGTVDDIWDKPFRIVQFGRTPVIVVKEPNNDIRALEATCSHLSCIVQYEADDNVIWCACHNARFNLVGEVISGPPPHGLEEYEVNTLDNGEIWISQKQA